MKLMSKRELREGVIYSEKQYMKIGGAMQN